MLMRLLNKPPFLSTPSGWRATRCDGRLVRPKNISIHALRVEGDLGTAGSYGVETLFLSTPSGWRAT